MLADELPALQPAALMDHRLTAARVLGHLAIGLDLLAAADSLEAVRVLLDAAAARVRSVGAAVIGAVGAERALAGVTAAGLGSG